MPDGAIGIITDNPLHRRWSADEQLRIVSESEAPGSGVIAAAARYGVCSSLVSN